MSDNIQCYHGAPFGSLKEKFKDIKSLYIVANKKNDKTTLTGFKTLEELEAYLKEIKKEIVKDE